MSGDSPAPDPLGRVVRRLGRVLKWLLLSLGALLAVIAVQVAAHVINMDGSTPAYLLRERKARADSLAAASHAHLPRPAAPTRRH